MDVERLSSGAPKVRVELAALRNDLSRPRGGKDVEHRLHTAEEDLRRAVHGAGRHSTATQLKISESKVFDVKSCVNNII